MEPKANLTTSQIVTEIEYALNRVSSQVCRLADGIHGGFPSDATPPQPTPQGLNQRLVCILGNLNALEHCADVLAANFFEPGDQQVKGY